MAHLHRLIVALCLFAAGVASAAFPPSSQWSWSFSSGSGTGGSLADVCEQARQWFTATSPPKACNYGTVDCTFTADTSGGGCVIVRSNGTAYTVSVGQSGGASCPQNATHNAAGNCTCNAGFLEKDKQCVPKKDDKCGDLEGRSLGLDKLEINVGVASSGALARMIGKDGSSCFPGGCKVSGAVSGCINSGSAGAVCFLSSPSFTGDSCDDKPPPGNCPEGSTPSQYAAGVCIPDEPGNCPAGQAPSKTNPSNCVPENDPDADGPDSDGPQNKCPSGYVPSRYVSGLCIPGDSATDRDGTTTCRGDVCTTTKPDGTQEEKPKQQFCEENPDSPLCVKGEFGGSCASGFQCKGDAVQCAIAREQHKRMCEFFTERTPQSDLFNREKDKEGNQTENLPGNETVNLANTISTADALGVAPAGLQDLQLTVWGQSVTLPISNLNPYLAILGNVLLAVSFLIAARIIGRG